MFLKRFYLTICLLIIIFPNTNWCYHSIVVSSEGQLYLVNSNEGYLFKYDPKSKKALTFHSLENINNCQSASLAFSRIDSADTKFAYSAFCSFSDTKTPINLYPNGFYRLTIIDSKSMGKIASLDNIGMFDFSPDGNAFVFISDYPGSYEGGGGKPPAGFESGIWIYDFKTKKKSKLDATRLNMKIVDINWSEHDGNIYLIGWIDVYVKVLRYSVVKANIEVVPSKGIYFSPDGKYNIYGGGEDPAKIYRTSDGREMIKWKNDILRGAGLWPPPPEDVAYMGFKFWSRKLNVFIVSCMGGENVVYDPARQEVVGKFKGHVLGTNSEGTLVSCQLPSVG